MGLFDFLKPKRDLLAELRDDTRAFPIFIMARRDKIAAQSNNLKAVGRAAEARELVVSFLTDVGRDCLNKKHWENLELITTLADSAILLGEPILGKQILDKLIGLHSGLMAKGNTTGPLIDLTQVYIDAGRIAGSQDEEYRCYWLAAEAKPPIGCKQPATRRQKAMAHYLAYNLSAIMTNRAKDDSNEWRTRREWHDEKRREFAPECDWDDIGSLLEWVKKGVGFKSESL
jgi:hypothetical protein